LKAIVTGASGFVGRELRRHLVAEGDQVLPFGPEEPDLLDVLDRDGVHGALIGSGAEAVYHLAALSHVGGSFENSVETIRVNVEGTLNVLDACREAGVGRMVIVGSAEEYGDASGGTEPLTEESPLRPVSPYGVSKVAAEYLGLQAFLSSGLGTIMTRSFNHTGPGQSRNFVVPALATRIAEAEREGRLEIETGRLDPVREFNDVRDIVRAYRLLVLHGRPGSIYNVCSGRAHSIAEVARRLIELSGRPLTLREDPSLVRLVEPPRLVGNPARLTADTGWRPEYSLDQTLEAILKEARRSISDAAATREP
jgi:GDP-4-dehydro-6-deoxy-D-mannose reductase